MSKYLKFFYCCLDTSNLIDSKIMGIITHILGKEPSEDRDDRFVKLEALDNSNMIPYRIKLTDVNTPGQIVHFDRSNCAR
ncbi:MAG: hypothetical protein AB1815_07710 [Bacillota bacterium]